MHRVEQENLVKHFNNVSDEFGDYLFSVDGIEKAEFMMFLTNFTEVELKTLMTTVVEARVLEINGEYS